MKFWQCVVLFMIVNIKFLTSKCSAIEGYRQCVVLFMIVNIKFLTSKCSAIEGYRESKV